MRKIIIVIPITIRISFFLKKLTKKDSQTTAESQFWLRSLFFFSLRLKIILILIITWKKRAQYTSQSSKNKNFYTLSIFIFCVHQKIKILPVLYLIKINHCL